MDLEGVREQIRAIKERLGATEKRQINSEKYCILVVEDDEYNLDALVRTFQDEYEVLSFSNAPAALEHIKTHKPKVDLVLTDQRMPKMSGVQLLEEVGKYYPQAMKLILTGYTETRDLIDAINRGEVYRYITKPADPGYLKIEVKQALEKYKLESDKHQMVLVLMDKNKQLEGYQEELKQTSLEILEVLGALVELKGHGGSNHASFVAKASEFVAGKLQLPRSEIMKIIQAAHLHDIGTMGLPDWVVAAGRQRTEQAESYYRQHPLLSEAVCLASKKLNDLSNIVRYHHEWWNGKGYPDGLKQDQIPLASRIIAVADGYHEFILEEMAKDSGGKAGEKMLHEKAIAYVKENEGARFDPKLVSFFVEFAQKATEKPVTHNLTLKELTAGMVVAEDVLTERGFVLIPKDTTLRKEFIEKVKSFGAYIAVREPIAVKG